MALISSREILEETDIKSTKTLTRWHQRSLIPPPEVKTHPDGRGKMAYWPHWVFFRIRKIKELMAEGQSLDEIAESLGDDWEADARFYRQRRKYDVAGARLQGAIMRAQDALADVVIKKIYELLQEIGVQRPGGIYYEIKDQFCERELSDRMVALVRQGCSPVAVVIGDQVHVVADFMVAPLLVHPKINGQPVLVVPIRDEVVDVFADVWPDLREEKVRYTPARKVIDTSGRKARVRSFKVKATWDFKIVD